MSRTDAHLDAMLRHLGAAYYDSLHGRASQGDVARAIAGVASEVGEEQASRKAGLPRPRAGEQDRQVAEHHGRWHSRVRDVMSADVITVDRITTFKEIAGLLVEHRISGVPVLTMGRHVAGVVTESDLIRARDKSAGTRRRWTGMLRYSTDHDRYLRLTAQEMMSAPAVTIHPDATIAAAARLMSLHHVKRLPVVDADGALAGLVSRRDLLSVFLVSDEAIARQVRELLDEIGPEAADLVKVGVKAGMVRLTSTPGAAPPSRELIAAVGLIWDIDGVVDVIAHLSSPQPA